MSEQTTPGEQREKTVWIVGAGFSRSLGGPLLDDLFAPGQIETAFLNYHRKLPSFPDGLDMMPYQTAVTLYLVAKSHPERTVPDLIGLISSPPELRPLIPANFRPYGGSPLWGNAEDFLSRLSRVAQAAQGRSNTQDVAYERITQQILRKLRETYFGRSVGMPSDIFTAAKRLVAAQCCAFVDDADVQSEAWRPYSEWAAWLPAQDTIVSFNYDRVLERIIRSNTELTFRILPVLPWLDESSPAAIQVRTERCTSLLKLHGSVSWRRNKSSNDKSGEGIVLFEETSDSAFAVGATADDSAIAVPGSEKLQHIEHTQLLWNLGKTALRTAKRIVFLGYRFPPSDTHPLQWFVDAIRNNDRLRTIEIVLGPNSPDAERVKSLVELAVRRRVSGGWTSMMSPEPVVHPLYVQDYFAANAYKP